MAVDAAAKVLAPIGIVAGAGMMGVAGINLGSVVDDSTWSTKADRATLAGTERSYLDSPFGREGDFSRTHQALDRVDAARGEWLGAGVSTAIMAATAAGAGAGALLTHGPVSKLLGRLGVGAALASGAVALFGTNRWLALRDRQEQVPTASEADLTGVRAHIREVAEGRTAGGSRQSPADTIRNITAVVPDPMPPTAPTPAAPLPPGSRRTVPLPAPGDAVPPSTIPGEVRVDDETLRFATFSLALPEHARAVLRAELGSDLHLASQDEVDNLDLGKAVAALDVDQDGILSSSERAPVLRAQALGFADMARATDYGNGETPEDLQRHEGTQYGTILANHHYIGGVPVNDIVHGLRMVSNHGGPASGLQTVSWQQLAHAADARIDAIA